MKKINILLKFCSEIVKLALLFYFLLLSDNAMFISSLNNVSSSYTDVTNTRHCDILENNWITFTEKYKLNKAIYTKRKSKR